MYMLNSDTIMTAVRHPDSPVSEKIKAHDVCVSAMAYAGVQREINMSDKPDETRQAVSRLLDGVPILPFDRDAAEAAADVRINAERDGVRLGYLDVMVAGHARHLGYTLVTDNVREFSRVEGLLYENWK